MKRATGFKHCGFLLVMGVVLTGHPSALNGADTTTNKSFRERLQELGPNYEKTLVSHARQGELFQKGDTNAALLIMEWFNIPRSLMFSRVSQTGGHSAGLFHAGGYKGGGTGAINSSNLVRLKAAMVHLPAAPKELPPEERRLIVSGIRTNGWFTHVYDRAAVPDEVETLYNLAGGRLDWHVFEVNSFTNVIAGKGGWPVTFRTGPETGFAASVGRDGLKITPTRHWHDVASTNMPPDNWSWRDVTLSADGLVVYLASYKVVMAIDRLRDVLLWRIGNPMEPFVQTRQPERIALGPEGKTLVVAYWQTLELLESQTGNSLSVLSHHNGRVHSLRTSNDGKILAVLFEAGKLQLWNMETQAELLSATPPGPAYTFELSPDGRRVVTGGGERNKLWLWDWETGQQEFIPIRGGVWHEGVVSIAWSQDGKLLAVAQPGQPVVVIETQTWKPRGRFSCPRVGGGASAQVGFAGSNLLLVLDPGGKLHGIDLATPVSVD